MCSGNFKLKPGAHYHVRVSAVDWAGNVSKPSNAISARAKP
jgi:hypothetical protein